MYLRDIKVSNFRLLSGIDLRLEDRTTTIVGRNNSGKTSLTEFFRRLLNGKTPIFYLEDFSLGAHEKFWSAFTLYRQGEEEKKIRDALPFIEAILTFSYADAKELGPLGEFVVDLNEGCTDAVAEIRYQLEDGKIKSFFEDLEPDETLTEKNQKEKFFRAIKDRVPKNFEAKLFAVDPNDPTNRKALEWARLLSLFRGGFINAHRGLDDTTHKENDVLGKILGALFGTAMSESANPEERRKAQDLEKTVQGIQENVDKEFNEQLKSLLPAFTLFGYPGLRDPQLQTETTFDVEQLLNGHTRIRYPGANGIPLPEAYNGLGARNLIFILLKLHEFFKSFITTQPQAGVHLIFIEEPEAHLHPQMQEVFISKLGEIADTFARQYGGGQKWPVQFIVTTHSSHIANRAPFKTVRYFLAAQEKEGGNFFFTKIKDLGGSIGGAMPDDQKFLQQYMTLTRCDLLFADKAILIEGTGERLLLPKMIEKIETGKQDQPMLSSQYISVVEVGGAYAHRFFKLLDFLELPALVITDIDAANDKFKKCLVSVGTHTTNGCLKDWFNNPNITPSELLGKSEADKISGLRRLAFQVPESSSGPCGRSFEEAFILANRSLFGLTVSPSSRDEQEAETQAANQKKSEFALRYAIDSTEWTVPRYIADGLVWLGNNSIGTEQAVVPAIIKKSGRTKEAAKKINGKKR